MHISIFIHYNEKSKRSLMSNSLNLNPGLSANLGHISKLQFSVFEMGIMIISTLYVGCEEY